MSELSDWMYAPRIEGWFAEDLDNLPEAPPHTELIHGSFVFRMAPEKPWHSHVVSRLAIDLDGLVPKGSKRAAD